MVEAASVKPLGLARFSAESNLQPTCGSTFCFFEHQAELDQVVDRRRCPTGLPERRRSSAAPGAAMVIHVDLEKPAVAGNASRYRYLDIRCWGTDGKPNPTDPLFDPAFRRGWGYIRLGGGNMNRFASLLCAGALASVFLAASAAEQERYICTVDQSTGFSFNKTTKQWEQTSFKPDGKYVVAPPSDSIPHWAKFVVNEVGNSSPTAFCEDGFDVDGELRCLGRRPFFMSSKRLRFLTTFPQGFWNDSTDPKSSAAEGTTTPTLSIGRCSRF